jgi:hypothetical protein
MLKPKWRKKSDKKRNLIAARNLSLNEAEKELSNWITSQKKTSEKFSSHLYSN